MLEPILKGLVEWIYEMMIDIMSYASGELIGVMNMDLTYFSPLAFAMGGSKNTNDIFKGWCKALWIKARKTWSFKRQRT